MSACPVCQTDVRPPLMDDHLAGHEALMMADWTARLDGFCEELESKGFGVERDGLTVRITVPSEST